MSDTTNRPGWLPTALLAVTTSAACFFAFLYFTGKGASDLGVVRVVVSNEAGQTGEAVRVVVGEGPLPQKGTVTPGPSFTGVVYYSHPYLTMPNLTINSKSRHYDISAQTETGFTWVARANKEDFAEHAKKGNAIEQFFGDSLVVQAARGRLKPGLILEDFSWEAIGIKAPLSALPPKTFEQKGEFQSRFGQEGEVSFPVGYAGPANVELKGSRTTIVISTSQAGFKWKNSGNARDDWPSDQGAVTWNAKGVLNKK